MLYHITSQLDRSALLYFCYLDTIPLAIGYLDLVHGFTIGLADFCFICSSTEIAFIVFTKDTTAGRFDFFADSGLQKLHLSMVSYASSYLDLTSVATFSA